MSTRTQRTALPLASILLLAIAPSALAGADTLTVRERRIDVTPRDCEITRAGE